MHRHAHSLLLFFALLSAGGQALAELTVQQGPTPILRGDAQGAADITVNNGLFAVAFAVDTAPPWGVARGGIVDIAIVRDGEVGYDIASLADFMPNNWSSWPSSYQTVSIEHQSADRVEIKTLRDWGDVQLTTHFTIRAGHSRIHMVTEMINSGSVPLQDLLSGYVVWPDGGYLFGVPGVPRVATSAEDEALADWSAAYDENWMLGLHAPYAKVVSYNGRDRYLPHALPAGGSRSFEVWLQIEGRGNLAPLVQAELERTGAAAGTISGVVTTGEGSALQQPAIVVLSNQKPYTWVVGSEGRYQLRLPVGEYQLYATAASHGRSELKTVRVDSDDSRTLDFSGVGSPGVVDFKVRTHNTREPLDARISIVDGYQPLIDYFGKKTFFTELDETGVAHVSLAPGAYQFEVSSGGGFTSLPVVQPVTVKPGAVHAVAVDIPVQLRPQQRNWYSADLHHHSDVLDGFTEPEYVLRSELAAGLDIAFLSDHDSVRNNSEMQRLSSARGLDFIAGTELSPSWAHFNAYPLDAGKEVAIDVGRSSVQQVFAEARRLGAELVHVNHPYGDYGYFRSLDEGSVPGGFDRNFDLIEITAGSNQLTMTRTWQLWSEGKRAYLAAGSDAHDVWSEPSGTARSYAYMEGPPSVANFVTALKGGHSYASQGPLVFPHTLFGTDVAAAAGEPLTLAYTVQSVSGLQSVMLIERGREVARKDFTGVQQSSLVVFQPEPRTDTWYSLVIEDMKGKFAYTNPVWVQLEH